jgi:hypothetical protein
MTNFMELDDLESMDQELTSILNKKEVRMADSRTIGIIASKHNFDVDKEHRLMENAKTTKCKCKHWTQTTPCFYRNCRHFPDTHYGVALV